ncbi:MAG: hypothetical protein ABSB83_07475 [Methanomassiliicoccales archaeon]|jgi:hypothetical protein
MTRITNLDFLSNSNQKAYLNVETMVGKDLRASFPGRSTSTCTLLTEEDMDRRCPPKIKEINDSAAARKVWNPYDLRDMVETYLKESFASAKHPVNLSPEQRDRLVSYLVEFILDYLAGRNLERLRRSEDAFVETNPDIIHALGHRGRLADFEGMLTFNNQGLREKSEEVEKAKKKFTTFTTMGCYTDGQVYLCPSRIEKASSSNSCILEEMLEIVWTHEEMHAVLNSDVHPDITEHIAQTMAAAVLERMGKSMVLNTMVRLGAEQPEAYALFSYDPNSRLLPIPMVKPPDIGPILPSVPTNLSVSKPRWLRHGLDPSEVAIIAKAIGIEVHFSGGRLLRTAKGKSIIVRKSKNRLSMMGDRTYRLVMSKDQLAKMPTDSTYVLLLCDGNINESYVLPASFLMDTIRDPYYGRKKNVVLGISVGDQCATLNWWAASDRPDYSLNRRKDIWSFRNNFELLK